ncbi:EAL domain-containing protein [Psychromonas sp.]|uniref:bifunctional diguanylate cyclase/phosphodiesterase n=1 Tax=Psychromonas sp. TaxID=1884585 RepID=UPI0035684C7F
MSIIIILMATIAGYLLTKNYLDKQSRLSELRLDIEQQNRDRITNELDSVLKYIRFMKDQAESVLMENTKERVDQVYAEIEATYHLMRDKYPESDIKQLIREMLRNVRFFNGRGYFFIKQLDGVTVLQPDIPGIEGQNMLYDKDDRGRFIELGLIQATTNPDKAGYYRYRWYVPGDSDQMMDKISYVRQFPPLNWIIGTGDHLFYTENDLKAKALKRFESMRFGKHGYIAVFTEDGQMLSGPTNMANMYSVKHKHAVQQVLVAAKGNGIAQYEWYYPDGRGPVQKESLVVRVPGWNWLLVSGFYPDDVNEIIAVQRQKLNDSFIEDTLALVVPLFIVFIIALVASLLSAKWLTVMFSRYQSSIYIHQSALKQTAKEMRHLAEYDPLTGLPNRRLLNQKAEKLIMLSELFPEEQLALLFIDLDRFKTINDSLGHAAGDQVLQQIAKRLSSNVRSTDIVCRLGGDEFVILMSKQSFPKAASDLATRLIKCISQPVMIEGHQLVLPPSIGIATYPDDGLDFATLQRNADIALYRAKEQGRNNYQLYSEHMGRLVSEQLELEKALRKAIETNAFELYYQPQYHLHDETLSGYEALIRWNCPERGFQAPDKFIPLAELSGLIQPIGDWVLHSACQQGASWLAKGFPKVSMSVNLSPYQLREELLVCVEKALTESGFPASLLTLEITETSLMNNAEQAIELLTQLKALGVGIALDDFGTGYSSLSYLKRFPLDELKIDKAFIDGLPDDVDDHAITSSIINIASNLKMSTVAEGVETEAQRNALIAMGCNQVQGYLYAKPMPPAELERFFAEHRQAQSKGA